MRFILAFLFPILSIQLAQSQGSAVYPLLVDSTHLVDGATVSLEDVNVMVEMSQLLAILGDYEVTVDYHNSILQNYQSRDIYQTAGVNAVLASLAYFGSKELPYILPLELDPMARLSATKIANPDSLKKRVALLQTALEQFNHALALDEQFLSAYLNKGCTLALLGAFDEAETCLKQGIKVCSTQKMTTDFLAMEGIVAALHGDRATAIKFLEQAKTIGSYLATQNLNIIQGKSPVATPLSLSIAVAVDKRTEQIEWYPLSDFLTNPSVDREVKVNEHISCGIQLKEQSRLFYQAVDKGKQYTLIQETAPDYKGATLLAITLKSSADNIQEAYGLPKYNLAMPDGHVWVYPEKRIFFRFNNRFILRSWGVYLKSQP